MLKRCKKWLSNFGSACIAKLTKLFLHLLGWTCRIHVEGIEHFCHLAKSREKCILMLWHNRLAMIPFILYHYTPVVPYAALVSGSRDGDVLSKIIHSYRNGNTIRVFHLARYQALREIVHYIEEKRSILIITPDGPRGPRYEVKGGVAMAAKETDAHVISVDWEAKRYWEFNTWDRLRLPKPFTTIRVIFKPSICLDRSSSLEEAKTILKRQLSEIW